MKRSAWYRGLLQAEELTFDGYSSRIGSGYIAFMKEGCPSVSFGRYNSEFGKDDYFQGMIDYIRNRDETK